MTKFVLGLDPGFRRCGYVLLRPKAFEYRMRFEVVAMGIIRTEKKPGPVAADNVRRAKEVAVAIERLMLTRAPDWVHKKDKLQVLFEAPHGVVRAVCAESMSHPRSAAAAAKVSLTWGVIIGAVVRRGALLLHHSPQVVKKNVVGTIDASKKHVERVLLKMYGKQIARLLDGVPKGDHEHAYDALAAATSCLYAKEFQAELKKEDLA